MQIRDQQLDNPNKGVSLCAGYKLFLGMQKHTKLSRKKTTTTTITLKTFTHKLIVVRNGNKTKCPKVREVNKKQKHIKAS